MRVVLPVVTLQSNKDFRSRVGVSVFGRGKTMTARDALTIILNLEELKKDTTVTRNVLSSAKLLLSLDEDGEPHVQRLMSEIREVYRHKECFI